MPLELLKAKIHDPEEKVRAAACKVYSQIDYEAALHHVSVEQLHAVAERGMDKKVVYFLVMYYILLKILLKASRAYGSSKQCRQIVQSRIPRAVCPFLFNTHSINLPLACRESNVKAAIHQFSWIPNEVLGMAVAGPETR